MNSFKAIGSVFFALLCAGLTGCAASTDDQGSLGTPSESLVAKEGEESTGESEEALKADPIRAVLQSFGFRSTGRMAVLPSGFDRTVVYSLATTRAGKPILPSGFREPSGGFLKTTSADAERWIASSMTIVPGRDRADVVGLRTDAELANASKAKSFAKALVSSVGASPRIVTNMTFSGSWSDVKSGGPMFQGMVLVVGSKGAALVYSDASD